MKNLKKNCRAALTALSVLILAALYMTPVKAEGYTYSITIYAGNKGSFGQEEGKMQITPDIEVNNKTVNPSEFSSDKIVISGLEQGASVNLRFREGEQKDASGNDIARYHMRGIRISGQDNGTALAAPAISRVDKDAAYVVAYGINSGMVQYTVRYEDTAGRTLHEPDQYWGSIGDKPVVGFRYIEGYQPQAYNLTGTLKEDASENVFTFVYRANPAGTAGGGGGGGGTTTTTTVTEEGETVFVDGAPAAGGGAGAGAGGGAGEGAGEEAGGGGGAGGGTVELPEQETPLDIIDLDEEETPLANRDLSDGSAVLNPIILGVIGTMAAAALMAFFIYTKKRKKATEGAGEAHEGKE